MRIKAAGAARAAERRWLCSRFRQRRSDRLFTVLSGGSRRAGQAHCTSSAHAAAHAAPLGRAAHSACSSVGAAFSLSSLCTVPSSSSQISWCSTGSHTVSKPRSRVQVARGGGCTSCSSKCREGPGEGRGRGAHLAMM